MSTPFIDLTARDTWELREVTRRAVGRVACRALMVLWHVEGLSALEISQRLACHRDTVSLWLERYRALGVSGLEDDARSGRPPHLDAAVRAQVEAALEQSPSEADQPQACWTLKHLRTVFQQVCVTPFCLETLRRTVHQLGFRWRRPRLWAHKEDPETFEKQLLVELARQQTEAQNAPPADAAEPDNTVHFLYADASDQRLLAVIRSMWMRRGRQVRVQTPPQNAHWSLFGALDVCQGTFHWQAYGQAISGTFIQFMEYLLVVYPRGEILLVVDNASYHTSKIVVAWLKIHPRILPIYLPTRRPDLNPVERIWGGLKDAISANRSFGDLFTLGTYIRKHFERLSPSQLLAQAGVRNDFCEAT